jgi:hypothetical protein
MLSMSEFGDNIKTGQMFQQHGETPPPLSLSSSNNTSTGAATAWSNRSLGQGRTLPYSSKTAGTMYKFDDAQSSLPSIKE